MNAKVFLDFGANDGSELQKYIEKFNMYTDWRIFAFECDPINFEKFKKDILSEYNNVDVFDFIAADKDCVVDLSQVLNDEWNPWDNKIALEKYRNIGMTRCFDVSEFIRSVFLKDDYIVIRMNIAGAEYSILEKMIEDGTIDYMNELYINLHSKNFEDKNDILSRESKILDELMKRNIKYHVIN